MKYLFFESELHSFVSFTSAYSVVWFECLLLFMFDDDVDMLVSWYLMYMYMYMYLPDSKVPGRIVEFSRRFTKRLHVLYVQ